MGAADARVVILTKAPIPGRVKTRLAPAIGLEGAARLHRAFVDLTITKVAASGLPFAVSVGADPSGRFARELQERGLWVTMQAEGDLGDRMAHELQRGPDVRVLIGTDCPLLEPSWLHLALARACPIALGPTEDGGYWGIAMQKPLSAVLLETVFTDMPWSTPDVLRTTVARCARIGAPPSLLPSAWDVDEPPELARLQAHPRCPPPLRALLQDLRPS